jgi:hypothetical protein
MELRDLIAGTIRERQWDEERGATPGEHADAILAAMDKAGLVVVPKSFVTAVTDYVTYEKGTNKGFASRWEALKEAASPFAKKEVG